MLPFVNDIDEAHSAVKEIQNINDSTGSQPLVFSTLVNDDVRNIIATCGAHVFDLFGTYIRPLETILETESTHKKGLMHGIRDYKNYHYRVSALNYTLSHDDGLGVDTLDQADIIIIGVSRCGKTPTALYLAMQFSLKAANYPLIQEDLDKGSLPDFLKPLKNKLIGLNISPEQLSNIRQERKPDSTYASLNQCKLEIKQALNIFASENITYLDSSSMSIEEIATEIVQKAKLRRINY